MNAHACGEANEPGSNSVSCGVLGSTHFIDQAVLTVWKCSNCGCINQDSDLSCGFC